MVSTLGKNMKFLLLLSVLITLVTSGCVMGGNGTTGGGPGLIIERFDTTLDLIESNEPVGLQLDVRNQGDYNGETGIGAPAIAEIMSIDPMEWIIVPAPVVDLGTILAKDPESQTQGGVGRAMKTGLVKARTESFDFLGYTFGPHHSPKNGYRYLGASPSNKSVQRLKQKIGELLRPQNVGPWPEVRDRLNRMLVGWSNYFNYGTRKSAYRAVDNYVYERVRGFLRRRHKVSSRGTRRFSGERVYGKLGVTRLRHIHIGRPPATASR